MAEPAYPQSQYLARLDDEIAAYANMKQRLLRKHRGEYVLVHNGSVLDHDVNDVTLFKRALKRLGDEPFLIRKVQEEKEAFIIPVVSEWKM